MGKHETNYVRVERDLYPTPLWVIDALAEHVDLAGKVVWEPATGIGRMAEALKGAGAARVYTTHIVARDYPLDEVMDFLSARNPRLQRIDALVSNPPYGRGNRLAAKFIARGLERIAGGGTLALLPVDFDSGKTRYRFFRDCPAFAAKIVLTQRIILFDAPGAAPKENHSWFVWHRGALRSSPPPIVLYAPTGAALHTDGGATRLSNL
jgi:hypothetical protein